MSSFYRTPTTWCLSNPLETHPCTRHKRESSEAGSQAVKNKSFRHRPCHSTIIVQQSVERSNLNFFAAFPSIPILVIRSPDSWEGGNNPVTVSWNKHCLSRLSTGLPVSKQLVLGSFKSIYISPCLNAFYAVYPILVTSDRTTDP